jgi:hypothetical protein
VLHLYGIPVAPEDARHLIATLLADRSPDALSAAEMISKGVERELYAIALRPEERDAMLSVLENPPESLAELRGALAWDFEWRQREGLDTPGA